MDHRNSQTEQEQEYRPRIQHGEQRVFDGDACVSIDQCEKIPEMDDSQLVGAPVTAAGAAKEELSMVAAEVKVAEVSNDKRRRGRPPRTQGKTAPLAPPPPKRKKDEEDVCFICFDGGSLVLCDRRGCPKAYHPACIKRDEAFFRSKAKWNCGWHICSSCQKASHFMCYTCTYSLCKGCTKDANYVCVRGNKGLCGTCMRTIMLIENIAPRNEDMVQVDFDDNTSWEYLFKVYWIFLKTKLSLTLDELTKAKNPWKGDELPKAKNSCKEVGIMAPKAESPSEPNLFNNEKGSFLNHLCGNLVMTHSKRRKTHNYQPKVLNEESSQCTQKLGLEKVAHLPDGITWATNELLEFVSHMKNGDVSKLSQIDVQALLLEYVKRNNLRDPRKKSQIVCDRRLITLFGKDHVSRIEMPKLLDCHFLVKEKSSGDTVRAGVVDVIGSCKEATGNNNCQPTMGSDRRRKTRKKTDEGGSVANPNPDDYAAVDVHNISLLYMKRNLIESLMDDTEKFQEKIIGSFVRIRISCGDPKQDLYRLVQVVGTSKVAESYQVGTRTTNFMLEILNLDKKEAVSIEGISNQEFSEDECNCLRQSIKCGLIKCLKVGEIQKKAMMLREVKIDDCLETEILRLNHLHDRASEKGHRKELREYEEKLERLKSPEERKRRLHEALNVLADPDMDPSHESEANAGEADKRKQGNNVRPRIRGGNRKESEAKMLRGGDVMNYVGCREQMSLAVAREQGRNVNTAFYMDNGAAQIHEKAKESTLRQEGETAGLNGQNISKVGPTGSVVGFWNSHALAQSESSSGIVSTTIPPALSTSRELSASDPETDILWHYQDPSGKIQGPFGMSQLRKWSSGGLFPLDLKVWRINDKQEDSILLTDALIGQFHSHSQLPPNCYVRLHGVATINDTDTKWELGLGRNSEATWLDNKKVDHSWTSMQIGTSVMSNGSDLRSSGWGSHSSSCTTAVNAAIANGGQVQVSGQGRDFSGGSNSVDQPQICNSHPSTSSSRKLSEMPLLQVKECQANKKCSSGSPHKTTQVPPSVNESDAKRADSEGHSSQSSEQSWKPPPREDSSSGWDPNAGFVSMAKPVETLKHDKEIDFSDLLGPTPKQGHTDIKGQSGENKQSVSRHVPAMESGPSWSTASSLVVGGAQLPEVVGEWGSYASNPVKTSVEEWDSNLVAASSLKPTEGASDHAATPTSGNGQLTHSSSNNPAVDASSWQPIVPESNEFSLVDESVSDLLAEVEAMESLVGLPSPTSKMRCDELTQDSDDDCFTPVKEFSPVPGKSDALSSTSDIQMPSQLTTTDERLRLTDMPLQPTVTTAEPLGTSQRPLPLTVTDEPLQSQTIIIDASLHVSQVPSQLPVVDEPLQTSNLHSQSSVTDERLEIPQGPSDSTLPDESLPLLKSEVLDPQKSCSGHSSTIAEAGGDTRLSDVSVNQQEASPKLQPPASSTINQGETSSDIRPPTPSTVSQREAGSEIQQTAPTILDSSLRSSKGNANLSQGGAARGKNTVWGSGNTTVRQQHAGINPATSTGNPGGWGNQPRYGGDRFSGPRDHRNSYPDRNSGYGRDRSSWNRQPLFGAGSGGGPFRPPSKGQRVCKFYESGYCKKGASCSYYHPG
uniref:Zinc finger CCCH domain-containing protein 44 n=1 Tax=Rhizophora mucronata TaxID=61149 RepID=A0A2P2JR79_RHIMU